MKKVLSLILALILAFSLGACGNKAPENKPVSTPEATAAPEPTPTPTPTPEPVSFEFGSVKGSSYINRHFKLACDFGPGWILSSSSAEEKMAEMELDGLGTELDALSVNTESALILMGDMNDFSKDDFDFSIQALKQGYLMTLTEAMAQDGITDPTIEQIQLEFAGRSCDGFEINGNAEGEAYHGIYLFLFEEQSVALIYVDCFGENVCPELLNKFYEPSEEQIAASAPEKAPVEEASKDNSPAADSEEKPLERGVSNGNVYESEFLGIGCKLDNGWMIYDDNMLEALMGLTAGFMQDENSREALEQMDGFFDFCASANQGLYSMNILLQNMGKLFGLVMDEDGFVDSTLSVLAAQLEANGMVNVNVEETRVEFAGKERRAIHSSAEFNGAPYYTTSIFLKSGDYMATVSLSSYNEDVCSSFADYFYALG